MYAIAKKTENGMKYLCFNGKMIVGTKEYIIKRKLMRQMYCNDNTIFKET